MLQKKLDVLKQAGLSKDDFKEPAAKVHKGEINHLFSLHSQRLKLELKLLMGSSINHVQISIFLGKRGLNESIEKYLVHQENDKLGEDLLGKTKKLN